MGRSHHYAEWLNNEYDELCKCTGNFTKTPIAMAALCQNYDILWHSPLGLFRFHANYFSKPCKSSFWIRFNQSFLIQKKENYQHNKAIGKCKTSSHSCEWWRQRAILFDTRSLHLTKDSHIRRSPNLLILLSFQGYQYQHRNKEKTYFQVFRKYKNIVNIGKNNNVATHSFFSPNCQ